MKDTTQFIIEEEQEQQSNLKALIPLEQDAEGKWVQAPEKIEVQGGDLNRLVPEDHVNVNVTTSDEPMIVPKNAAEVAYESELEGSNYWELKLKQGKFPLVYGRIGEAFARGEISQEEAMGLADVEHLRNLELQDRLEILTAEMPWIAKPAGGALSYLPYLVDSTIEAAKGALMFGTGAAVTAILTGGATVPLIPGLMAAGGTYGVIKNTMEVEGMGLYLDLVRKGMNPDVALPMAVSAGIAMGIVEVYSLKLFGAGFKRKVAEAVMSQLGKNALINMTAFWAKSSGIQIGQEVVQEAIEIATKFFGSIVTNNPSVMPEWEEIVASYEELLSAEGAGGLALLSVPGAMGVGVSTRSANIKKAQQEVSATIDKKNAEDIAAAAEKEVEGVVTEEMQVQEAVVELNKEANLEVEAEAAGTADEEGMQGSSFSADGKENLIGTPNIAVSIFPDLSFTLPGRLTPETAKEEIGAFREEHKELLEANPELAVGTYFSEDTNTTFIDLVSIVPEAQLETAIELGREFNQISVFNLRTFEEIETGGTGEAIDVNITPQDRVSRMKELLGIEEARGMEDVIVGGQFSGGEKIPSKPSKPDVTPKTQVSQDGQTKAERDDQKRMVTVTKKKVVEKRKDIEGRINKLVSEKKVIQEKIEEIGKDFKKGKITEVQLERKLESEYTRLIALEDKLVPLQLLEDYANVDLGAVKVELRANEVKALQLAVVKEKALALERGIKAGRRVTRSEILEIQNEIIAAVMSSEATEAGKRNALKAMRKVQTEKQLDKALPEMIKMLDRSAERAKKAVLINKFKKLTKAKAVHELRPNIKKEIESILETFTAVKPSKMKVARVISALKENEANELSDDQLLHLAGLDRKPLSELSFDDLQGVHDAVSHLIWLNSDINKAIEQERTAQDQKNVEEAVGNLGRKYKDLTGSVEGLDSLQKEEEKKLLGLDLGGVKDIPGVGSYNMELIGEILDGEDNGIIQRIMYREIDKGEARSLKFKHDAEDYFIGNGLREILKDDSWSEFFAKKFKKVKMISFTLDSGQTIKISKGTRIAIMLHARNEDSRRHLIEGGFVLRRHLFAKVKKMTSNDLDFITKNASAEEKQVANTIYGYFNSIQKAAINKTSLDLLGFEVAVVQNYFPIQVWGQALTKEERVKGLHDTNSFIRDTLEGMGIFKRRVKSNAPIVLTDAFEVTHQQIQKVAAYIGLAAPLRRAKALLHAPDFKAALETAGLGKYRQSMEDYVSRVEGDSIRNDSFDKLTQHWINKLDVANLALNVGVMMKQPVSYFLAATEMEVKYIMSSFKPHVSHSLKVEIKKWSPHFRDRFEGNVTREMGEVASVGRTRRFFTGRELMSNKFMWSIKVMDTMAIAGIWRATKKEVAAKNPSLKVGSDEFMQKVADRAWFVARRTQPTFSIKDRSTIGRKQNTFWRLATKYSSQRNKNWMIQRRAFEAWNRGEKTAANLGKLIAKLALIRGLAPAMIAGVNTLRGMARDGDDEEALYKRFFFDWLKVTLGDIYIISGVLQMAIDKASSKGFGFGMTDPLTSSFELAGNFIGDITKMVMLTTGLKDVKNRRDYEKKRDKLVERLYKESIDLGSKISGVPVKSAAGSVMDIAKLTGVVEKKEDTGKFKRHVY